MVEKHRPRKLSTVQRCIEIYRKGGMNEISGRACTLQHILQNTRFTIHYSQREYMWHREKMQELIGNLTGEFLQFYDPCLPRGAVVLYGVYFMGLVVFAGRDNIIIDGRQRLTSLTLLLIYVRRRLLDAGVTIGTLDQMIRSETHGTSSFNINVDDDDWTRSLAALFDGEEFDPLYCGESVQNLCGRYADLVELFPEDIDDAAMPYFADWLISKVVFIGIVAKTEQDAHKVCEIMNGRSPAI